jgi:hypothetical protein
MTGRQTQQSQQSLFASLIINLCNGQLHIPVALTAERKLLLSAEHKVHWTTHTVLEK